jgi:hypothetical protein
MLVFNNDDLLAHPWELQKKLYPLVFCPEKTAKL